jgi:hypothetical protein
VGSNSSPFSSATGRASWISDGRAGDRRHPTRPPGPSHRVCDTLANAATGYLLPPTACAAAVLLSPATYFVLPFRGSTLALVITLGLLTLLRPLVIPTACLGALANGMRSRSREAGLTAVGNTRVHAG